MLLLSLLWATFMSWPSWRSWQTVLRCGEQISTWSCLSWDHYPETIVCINHGVLCWEDDIVIEEEKAITVIRPTVTKKCFSNLDNAVWKILSSWYDGSACRIFNSDDDGSPAIPLQMKTANKLMKMFLPLQNYWVWTQHPEHQRTEDFCFVVFSVFLLYKLSCMFRQKTCRITFPVPLELTDCLNFHSSKNF